MLRCYGFDFNMPAERHAPARASQLSPVEPVPSRLENRPRPGRTITQLCTALESFLESYYGHRHIHRLPPRLTNENEGHFVYEWATQSIVAPRKTRNLDAIGFESEEWLL